MCVFPNFRCVLYSYYFVKTTGCVLANTHRIHIMRTRVLLDLDQCCVNCNRIILLLHMNSLPTWQLSNNVWKFTHDFYFNSSYTEFICKSETLQNGEQFTQIFSYAKYLMNSNWFCFVLYLINSSNDLFNLLTFCSKLMIGIKQVTIMRAVYFYLTYTARWIMFCSR